MLRKLLARASIVALTVLLALPACAARSARRLPSTARADALVAAGCYTCLLEAQAIYETVLAARPSAAVAAAAFRTAILLSLREKELGLPATRHVERARTLLPQAPPVENPELVLEIEQAINWDYAALSREDTEAFIKTRRAASRQVDGWRERLRPRLDDPVTAYLEISLVCTYVEYRDRDAALDPVLARHPGSPLVKYRVGACRSRDSALLEEVLEADPRFTEAQFFIGRNLLALASAGRGRASDVAPRLAAAYDMFPHSPSVTMAMAGLSQVSSRWEQALQFFDRTIALVPLHREAMLGRTVALTRLGRRHDAIAAANALLDAGTWYIGDAYYWRAFNYHALGDLDRARDDVELAKERSGIRAEVFLLAGTIYYDRREMDAAVRDLERARELDQTLCGAPWYLGLIHAERKQWAEGASDFQAAADCYRNVVNVLEAELAARQKVLGETDEGREVAAAYQRQIDGQRFEEARAAFNVAYSSGQIGDRERALAFARRAAAHERMKVRATELIEAIEKVKP